MGVEQPAAEVSEQQLKKEELPSWAQDEVVKSCEEEKVAQHWCQNVDFAASQLKRFGSRKSWN